MMIVNWKHIRNHTAYLASLLLLLLSTPSLAGGGGSKAGNSPYIPLEPAFIVNYGSGPGKAKFLKAELSVKVSGAEIAEAVQHHMPLIRNGLVLLLSSQTEEAMISSEGKEALRQAALIEINRLLAEEVNDHAKVDEVLFTNLVTQ